MTEGGGYDWHIGTESLGTSGYGGVCTGWYVGSLDAGNYIYLWVLGLRVLDVQRNEEGIWKSALVLFSDPHELMRLELLEGL